MSAAHLPGRRGRLRATAAAGVLAVLGAALLVIGVRGQQHPPQPPASAAAGLPSPSTPAPDPRRRGGQPAAAPHGPVLPGSTPVRLDVPALGVHSDLLQLGLNADHTVQVPPLGQVSRPGWYRYSPTPGQLGPSVILGHVDSARYGPGVFFRLGALRPGDRISVARSDRSVAVFSVDSVDSYPKASFPTLRVYGNTDHAALRLITCGGDFDRGTGSYLNNIVAYASLVSSNHL